MIFIEVESAVVTASTQIDKKYKKFSAFGRFGKTTRWLIRKNRNCLQIFISNADIACLRRRVMLLKERLVLRYAQGRGTGHPGLARPEARRAGARPTYIDCFGLHVFLSSLVLIY